MDGHSWRLHSHKSYKNLNFADGTRKDFQVRTLKNQVVTR